MNQGWRISIIFFFLKKKTIARQSVVGTTLFNRRKRKKVQRRKRKRKKEVYLAMDQIRWFGMFLTYNISFNNFLAALTFDPAVSFFNS